MKLKKIFFIDNAKQLKKEEDQQWREKCKMMDMKF